MDQMLVHASKFVDVKTQSFLGPASNIVQILWLLNPEINLEYKEAYPGRGLIQHIDHSDFYFYFSHLIRRIKYQIQVRHTFTYYSGPEKKIINLHCNKSQMHWAH